MPSVRTIAKQAGVSPATVSRVFNNHPAVSARSRARVLEAAGDYAPAGAQAKAPAPSDSANIAFVYTDTASLNSPFDMALLNGLVQAIEEMDMDLLILDANRSRLADESYTKMFARKGVRGAVMRTTALSRYSCKDVWQQKFPAVFVGDRFEEEAASFVDAASQDASYEAVQHLVGLGHKRIAVATNVVDDTDHTDRTDAYDKALRDHGIEPDPRLFIRVPANIDGGRQLIRRLVGLGDAAPTAIYIADPQTCIGAINEARAAGISIPEQLSIVGFDDSDTRFSVHPSMTAVCQNANVLGREAMSMLAKRIADPTTPPQHRVLPAWFEVNHSTASPRTGALTHGVSSLA